MTPPFYNITYIISGVIFCLFMYAVILIIRITQNMTQYLVVCM